MKWNGLELQAIIYLWTRDAKMEPNEETEKYIKQHLQAILGRESVFSNPKRAEMAKNLSEELW